jgi:hypothetical protein
MAPMAFNPPSTLGTTDTGTGARPRCYVASALGFTEAGRDYYARVHLPMLATVIDPVDPWALISGKQLAEAHAGGPTREMSLEIGRRNTAAIRSSDMLVAYLDGQDPGTIGELGFAAGLGLPCFGLRTDFRDAGGANVMSLQVETFVLEAGGVIYESLEDLVAGLRDYVSRLALAA